MMKGTSKRSRPVLWDVRDRSGLGRRGSSDGSPSVEHFVSVPFDYRNPKQGFFDLYYFVFPSRVTPVQKKVVLFCAGGPGQIVRPDTLETSAADFLYDNGYDVVHFHLRGSGYSQFPASGAFDKFLRTRLAVNDIEAIRKDCLGEKGVWDGIIARSYGTVLAHQYSRIHKKGVRKLILIAPLSRHMFKLSPKDKPADAATGFDRLSKDITRIQRDTLKKIFDSTDKKLQNEFGDLRKDEEKETIDALFGSAENDVAIFEQAENAFGSVQFIVDKFDELADKGFLNKYKLEGLSRNFFRCIRDLRLVGSLTGKGIYQEDRQLTIGKTIRDELYARTGRARRRGTEVSDQFPGLQRYDNQSQRVLYTMGVFDGTNPRLLKELYRVDGKRDLRQIVRSAGGSANMIGKTPVNTWLDKIRINKGDKIEPWDPATYSHSIPTLILEGGADPVTAAGQAEYIFEKALKGHRTLIKFSDVGHDMELPEAAEEDCRALLSGVIHVPRCVIPGKQAAALSGAVEGRRLDSDLHIELTPRSAFPTGLECRGYGIPSESYLRKMHLNEDECDIVLVIENTSTHRSRPVDFYWDFTRSYYSGLVKAQIPAIPGKASILINGKIASGVKDSTKEPRLTAQSDFEKGLELFGYSFIGGDGLQIWLKNKSADKIDGKTRTWEISAEGEMGLIGKLKFDSPPIDPGEVAQVDAISIDGLAKFARGAMDLRPVNGARPLQACIVPLSAAEEYVPQEFSIGIVNPSKKTIPARTEMWRSENYAFSATLEISHKQILPRDGVIAKAKFKHVTWEEWLKIVKPSDCEPGVTLAGYNILEADQIQLLIQNENPNQIASKARDWFYVDPFDNPNFDNATGGEIKSACLNSGKFLDGLLYSFLMMKSDQFKNQADNKILGLLERAFKELNASVSIEHRSPGR